MNNGKRTIVHIIVGLNIGGAELMLKRLIENKKLNFNFIVISLTDFGALGQDIKNAGIEVIPLHMKNKNNFFPSIINLYKELRRIKPSVVQTWMYHSDFIGGLLAKLAGVKRIYWNVRNEKYWNAKHTKLRSFINYLFVKSLSLLSYFIPHKIVHVSKTAQKSHLKFGYSKSKGIVIYNGFDTDKFKRNNITRLEFRESLKLSPEDIAICSVGNYSYQKDHITFIKAIKQALKENKNFKAILVGRDLDTCNQTLVNEIGEEYMDNFILLGRRSDVVGILNCADIFCLHSIIEGFPNVLGEAMSVGLPCVVTKCGDAPFILDDKNYTCEVGDSSAISEKLLQLSSLTHEERLKLGDRNRARVIDNYHLSKVLTDYHTLYEAN